MYYGISVLVHRRIESRARTARAYGYLYCVHVDFDGDHAAVALGLQLVGDIVAVSRIHRVFEQEIEHQPVLQLAAAALVGRSTSLMPGRHVAQPECVEPAAKDVGLAPVAGRKRGFHAHGVSHRNGQIVGVTTVDSYTTAKIADDGIVGQASDSALVVVNRHLHHIYIYTSG